MIQPEQETPEYSIPRPHQGKINRKVRPVFWLSFLLVLAIFVTYGQLNNCEFINLDDPAYVYQNPHIRNGLTFSNMFWSITAVYGSNWHPLTWLSHMIDIELYGMDAGSHHYTNLIIHILNSLLLFLLLRQLSGKLWSSVFIAALFALHPINVESVAWVAQRKTLLSSFFWILATWSYCRYVRQPGFGNYFLILLLFICGLMAKPMVVTFPILLLLLDYWPLGRFSLMNGLLSTNRFWRLIIEKIPFFVISAGSSIITYFAQKWGGAVTSLDVLPLDVRIYNALLSYVTYLSKVFWPHHLAILYPHPRWIPGWKIGLSLGVLGFISYGAIKSARRYPYVLVGWLWFLVVLIPVIGAVQIGVQAMADRYAYLSVVGVFTILVWGYSDISTQWRHRTLKHTTMAGVIIIVLMATTLKQVNTWHNSLTVFGHALSVTEDNYLAHNSMGMSLSEQEELDEAVAHFSEALKIDSDFEDAWLGLGTALFMQNKFEKAVDQFFHALRINAHNAETHNNLGASFAMLGKTKMAMHHYKAALAINPDYADAHRNIAELFFNNGAYETSDFHYQAVLRINPSDNAAHRKLGLLRVALGEHQKAVHHFLEALRIVPNDKEARHNLKLTVSLMKRSTKDKAEDL